MQGCVGTAFYIRLITKYVFMKKILLLTTGILMALSTESMAQYLSLGPVGGFGGSWTTGLPGSNRTQPSGYLGLGLVYSKNIHWGWGAQLEVSSEGYRREAMGDEVRDNPVYLRLPIRGYYFFGDYGSKVRPKVYLGPSFGLKLGESSSMSTMYSDAYMAGSSNNFRTFDFGLDAGAGLNVRLAKATWLNMDLGYYQGLMDAVKNDAAGNTNMNENLRFNVGVLFGLK